MSMSQQSMDVDRQSNILKDVLKACPPRTVRDMVITPLDKYRAAVFVKRKDGTTVWFSHSNGFTRKEQDSQADY